jgi:lysine biosynthesis protein LysW
MATCPECDAEIEIDQDDLEEMEVGDPWNCDACGSSLRVANLTPLEFDGDEDDDEDEDEEDEAEEAADTEDDDLDDDDEDDDDEKDGDWDE